MGSCLSKKSSCASYSPTPVPNPPEKANYESPSEKKKAEEETVVKKEIFIIKHRRSHEVEKQRSDEEKAGVKNAEEFVEKAKNVSSSNGFDGGIVNGGIVVGGGVPVRTSSCTKEEIDAILIQCGRLSRSSSTGKEALLSENGGMKYSGSKRSYDFDENRKCDANDVINGDDDAVARERENRPMERRRHSQGRRRTPSREKEREQAARQRSGSRERGSSGGGRRVSRSPGRRSESPITTHSGANSNSAAAANANFRPGKLVSVPATVSSLATDKNTNAGGVGGGGEPNTAAAVKRIQVKRNVGGDGTVGARTAASPRARSPARVRASSENQNANSSLNQQHPMSLSRSNSRKAEHSPHRRNPLGEIDTNIISQKPNADSRIVQGDENIINSSKHDSNKQTSVNCNNQEQQLIAGHVALNVISPGPENQKANAAARRRSSRLSRDLDINPESLSNHNDASYTALLLEDIQNFHQKNTPAPAAFSLPPCVTKACAILEAVADLNSGIGSNLSTTFVDDHCLNPNPITEQMNKANDKKLPLSTNPVRKTKPDIRDPILESEVVVNDDLMKPSFHKYVTVRRGTRGDDDLEEQESSGSNSFVGSQQQWLSSSCWEPNSAESTDRWTSSARSVSRKNDVSPIGFQRHAISEMGRGADDGGKKLSAAKKRDSDHQHNGIGKGRISTRGSHMTPPSAT